MKAPVIEMIDLSRIRDRENNPKIHPEAQIRQIVNSLSKHGAYNPALVDEKDVLIAGHGRIAAARRLGWKQFPCIVLHGLTEAQKLALMLADNKIAENASTDRGKLASC